MIGFDNQGAIRRNRHIPTNGAHRRKRPACLRDQAHGLFKVGNVKPGKGDLGVGMHGIFMHKVISAGSVQLACSWVCRDGDSALPAGPVIYLAAVAACP